MSFAFVIPIQKQVTLSVSFMISFIKKGSKMKCNPVKNFPTEYLQGNKNVYVLCNPLAMEPGCLNVIGVILTQVHRLLFLSMHQIT